MIACALDVPATAVLLDIWLTMAGLRMPTALHTSCSSRLILQLSA